MPQQPQSTRTEYAHFLAIGTRWMDNDIYGHVNNAVYYAYFDTAINQYLIAHGGLDIVSGQIIGLAVETHCAFMQSLAFPDVIDAGLRVGKLGNSSVRYELSLFKQHENMAAATGYFVHVFVDRETRRPVPIPPITRAALERLVLPTH